MRNVLLLSIICLISNGVFAQKKSLDHSVYDGWQNIIAPGISKNSQYIAYTINPQEGDKEVVVTNTTSAKLYTLPRADKVQFTEDSKHLVFLINPPYADVRQAKIKKKKPEDMPKDSLGIVTLGSSSIVKVANVSSFKLPEKSGDYLAYLTDKPDDSTNKDKEGTKDSKKQPKKSSTLHVRTLSNGDEKTFDNVRDFFFNKDGSLLSFVRTVEEKDSVQSNGLYLFNNATQELKRISSGKGTYQQLVFDEEGGQLAFVAEKEPEKALSKPYSLYYYTMDMDTANVLINVTSPGIPKNWNVSGEGALRFSKNGSKLFFGLAPIPPIKDTTIVDFEVADVDIWHYQDDYLQPQQLVNLKKDLNRSYLALTVPKQSTKRVVPLSDEEIPDAILTQDADEEFLLATSNYGGRIPAQWEGTTKQNLYIISSVTGDKRKIVSDAYVYPQLSPKGNFVVWYDLSTHKWKSHNIHKNTTVVLNENIPVNFADEDHDSPSEPRPYGIAGWADDEKRVLIYDKFDIWSFDPSGGDVKLITNGAGRSQGLTFRYRNFDNSKEDLPYSTKAEIIPLKNPLLLAAFNHINKENGWYSTNARNVRDPKKILMGPYTYRQEQTVNGSNTLIFTKENYQSSPNLYVTTDNFKSEIQLSNINLQQQQYNWGTAELVKWTTPAGYDASGILYKPEDFDPNKKYPLIAYFYERLSDGLNTYIPPAPTPSRLNISYFVSNGYLVFAPDIKYQIGHPGKSAEEFINSGVTELAKFPWVDEDKLGIQGQSWGGYQVAHLITRTDMYAAAWAGAPVVNMTSAYGGIRWATGMNRQFQYEKTQSRIGADLWDGYDLYIENSPLFHLKSVNTPVVIMANDQDGAVPWYQGIEMFTALRRLNKPVWMLNYNGEEHNLVKRQNRKDIQIREQQFFDHYLKGEPAPVWIEKGVPATLKGIDWGFDLIN